MADIETKPATVFEEVPAVTVQTKSTLAAATSWTTTPGLFANTLALQVNNFDTASLFYKAGQAVAQIATPFAECPPLELLDQFVQISIAGGVQWTGIITDQKTTRPGVELVGGVRKYRARDQVFTAHGLEYLLDRVRIDSAVIDATTRVDRSIVFNGGDTSGTGSGRAQRGNRSSSTNGAGVYVFANAPGGSTWTAAQIIKYLLEYHSPTDSAGNPLPTVFTAHSSVDALLADYTPTLDPRGLTVYQCLNAICHPARGYCWWCTYTDVGGGNGEVSVHVEAIAPSAVTLPGGGTLPANTNQQTVDFDFDWTASNVQLARNYRSRYNRCRCRGARMTSTFTIGFGDTTLEGDWGSTLETHYKNGAKHGLSGAELTAYNALGDEDKQTKNDTYRRRELLSRVYSAFRIPAAWDKKAGDGGATSPPVTRDWAFADTEQTGSILGSLPVVVNNLRILPRTSLERGVDYSDPSNPVNNNPSGTEVDLLPPLVLVKVATSPDKWQLADKLATVDTSGSTAEGDIRTSYHVFAGQQSPGFVLRASGGQAHACAKNHWSGAEPTGLDPELDYENMIATITAEADTFCEGAYPASEPTGERLDELVIDLGDDYRLDFLCENTVVDVARGELVLANATTAAGRLLRDDREKLDDAARLAFEWYQEERVGLGLTLKQLVEHFELGMMITTIGAGETLETINTVVGEVTYNITGGSQSIKTLGDAIDFGGVLAG